MPYTFELTFTGLIIFTFKGDKRSPSEVNALLVDATSGHHGGGHHQEDGDVHVPLLSYLARNLKGFPEPAHDLAPGPDGALIGSHDLSALGTKEIKIAIDGGTLPSRKAIWRPEDGKDLPPEPMLSDPTTEAWLDWVMALQRMNRETPNPADEAPYAGLDDSKVIANLNIGGGTLHARGFRMSWDPVEQRRRYVKWIFQAPVEEEEGTLRPETAKRSDSQGPHAMAGSVVLSIPGIKETQPVVISNGVDLRVRLEPGRGAEGRHEPVVRASLTNLPKRGVSPAKLPGHLHHFALFYRPVDFGSNAPSKLRLPHVHTGTITRENSYCPPTTHTKKA